MNRTRLTHVKVATSNVGRTTVLSHEPISKSQKALTELNKRFTPNYHEN
jgi:hypothetical protein